MNGSLGTPGYAYDRKDADEIHYIYSTQRHNCDRRNWGFLRQRKSRLKTESTEIAAVYLLDVREHLLRKVAEKIHCFVVCDDRGGAVVEPDLVLLGLVALHKLQQTIRIFRQVIEVDDVIVINSTWIA